MCLHSWLAQVPNNTLTVKHDADGTRFLLEVQLPGMSPVLQHLCDSSGCPRCSETRNGTAIDAAQICMCVACCPLLAPDNGAIVSTQPPNSAPLSPTVVLGPHCTITTKNVVYFAGVESAAALDVRASRQAVTLRVPGQYNLKVDLPCPITAQPTKLRFIKRTSTLKVGLKDFETH